MTHVPGFGQNKNKQKKEKPTTLKNPNLYINISSSEGVTRDSSRKEFDGTPDMCHINMPPAA